MAADLGRLTGPELHGMQGVTPRRSWVSFLAIDHSADPSPPAEYLTKDQDGIGVGPGEQDSKDSRRPRCG
jgi:hypothetical protein